MTEERTELRKVQTHLAPPFVAMINEAAKLNGVSMSQQYRQCLEHWCRHSYQNEIEFLKK